LSINRSNKQSIIPKNEFKKTGDRSLILKTGRHAGTFLVGKK
jgi:hypothetical protein